MFEAHTPMLCTNPFGMGFAASPRMNFCLGLAAATSVPTRPMPLFMPMPYFYPNSYGTGYQLGTLLGMGTEFYSQTSNYSNYTPYSVNYQTGALNSESYLDSLTKSMPERPKMMDFSSYKPTKINSTEKSSKNSVNSFKYEEAELKPGLFKGALAGKEALVTKICKKYGVSPQIVACIIGIETGWGTSNLAVNHNNFGGYRAAGDLGKDANGHGYFSTTEKGLEAMIKNLASYPKRYPEITAVDWDNLDKIGKHYCEKGNWADKVREMYNTRVKQYSAIC